MITGMLIGLYIGGYAAMMVLMYTGGRRVPWWTWMTVLFWPAILPMGVATQIWDIHKLRKFNKTKKNERNEQCANSNQQS